MLLNQEALDAICSGMVSPSSQELQKGSPPREGLEVMFCQRLSTNRKHVDLRKHMVFSEEALHIKRPSLKLRQNSIQVRPSRSLEEEMFERVVFVGFIDIERQQVPSETKALRRRSPVSQEFQLTGSSMKLPCTPTASGGSSGEHQQRRHEEWRFIDRVMFILSSGNMCTNIDPTQTSNLGA